MSIVIDEIDLYVTMACNLKCTFCSVRANEYARRAFSLKRITNLISEAHDLGMKQLHLSGGEPTLRTDLEQIIAHTNKVGVTTRLITNGTLIDRDRLCRLQEAGLSSIMISVDGLEQTHDLMRGVSGSWRKAIDCVSMAIDLGLYTRISSVAFQNNMQEIPEVMRMASLMGVDVFSIFLGSPLGRGNMWINRVISPNSWRMFLKALKGRIHEFGPSMEIIVEQGFLWPDTNGYDRASIKGRGTGCSTLSKNLDYLIVRGDGNIYQCVFFLHDGPAICNVANQPLAEAIDYTKELSHYDEFVQLGTTCSSCEWSQICEGGCRGYSFLYSHDWQRPDPRCAKNEGPLPPPYYPLCPIAKLNLRTECIGGSSEQALS